MPHAGPGASVLAHSALRGGRQTAPRHGQAVAVRHTVLSYFIPSRVFCKVSKLAPQRQQRPVQMALHGALWLTHACRGLAYTKTLQMHQHKSLSLAPTKLRECVGNTSPEQWIARYLTQGIRELTGPEGTPALAHCTPTAVVVGLVDHDEVEPRGQTRFLSEAIQRPIGLDKRVLDHVLCGRIVATHESPCQAPRTLTV